MSPSPSKRTADPVFIALLRGINVGGKNVLPMKHLARMFEDAGGRNVKTYIQSGNVVFRAPAARAGRIASVVRKRIADELGLAVPVVIRTASDLARVAAANPYLDSGRDPKTLHVAFLDGAAAAARLSSLDPGRSPPDQFTARTSEIYLHCPGGMARTKLTNQYFDSRLATTCTIRNWATVLKLRDLAQE